MSGLGQTGVGDLFAAPASRASGLAGALGPRRRPLAPVDDLDVDDQPSPEPDRATEPASEPKAPRPKKAPTPARPATGDEQVSSRSLVVVYVTQEEFDWVGQQRKATDRTNAQVVLAAIESAAPRLASVLKPAAPAPTGMFSTPTTPGERGKERYVQLGLRGILPSDRDLLDKLVTDTGAGSLSALVRTALQVSRQL